VEQPLYNVPAEQSILGGLLIDADAYDRITGKVHEADFGSQDHRIIFRAISSLFEASRPVDIITLAEYLDSNKVLDKAGGLKYLGELLQATPSSANIEHYAAIVHDYALMRKMQSINGEIATQIHNRGEMRSNDLVDYAQSKWMSMSEHLNKAQDTMMPINQVLVNVMDHIDALATRDDQNTITGLATGLNDLDEMTTGMQGGELIILAARPSMGKTSFALNIAEHASISQGKAVALFSLEMVNNQLGVRLLSSVAKLPQQRVKIGRLYDDEWSTLTFAVSKLNDAKLFLDEESNIGLNEIRAKSRKLHRECPGGLGLIVIDYIQLIAGSGKGDNRAQEVSDISRGLKLLAKELNVPVIALSQLNRGLENRPNKRPIMSDLRDSGGIEQDADQIWFIYRDEVYNPDSMDKGSAEIIVAKQRNGPIGTARATFIGHLMRFENYAGMPDANEAGDSKKRSGNSRAKNTE
jgi:replicative DNA helicase